MVLSKKFSCIQRNREHKVKKVETDPQLTQMLESEDKDIKHNNCIPYI